MVTCFQKKSHRQPRKCHTTPIATSQLVSSEAVITSDPGPVKSQPVHDSESVISDELVNDSHVELVSDTATTSDAFPPSISISATSQKWKKYKNSINKARREKYRVNSQPAKTRSYKVYHGNPSPVKAKKREVYKSNPSPVKERVRQAYNLNPSPVKAKKREVYKSNPSPVKAHKKEVYKTNPSPVKERVRQAYNLNPSPVKAKEKGSL